MIRCIPARIVIVVQFRERACLLTNQSAIIPSDTSVTDAVREIQDPVVVEIMLLQEHKVLALWTDWNNLVLIEVTSAGRVSKAD
jgi:hypothetical protein